MIFRSLYLSKQLPLLAIYINFYVVITEMRNQFLSSVAIVTIEETILAFFVFQQLQRIKVTSLSTYEI